MEILIALLAGISVALFIFAIGRANATDDTHRRLALMREGLAPDILSESFAARILAPAAGSISGLLARILPSKIEDRARELLEQAGNPVSVGRFIGTWIGLSLTTTFGSLAVFILNGSSTRNIALATALWGAVGLYLPWFSLRRKVRARGDAIRRALPDAIDLVITNVEAGLGFQAALLMVSEKMVGPTAIEFGRVVREISLGRKRSEAFEQMAARCGVAEMRTFARTISQAERTGAPIVSVLRSHAISSREHRRGRARELAGRVPVKITLPTVLFMFPTLLILILGPVFIHAMDTFGKSP